MKNQINRGRIIVLVAAIFCVAIVAFMMGRSIGNDEKEMSQRAPVVQTIMPEKVVQNDTVFVSAEDTKKYESLEAGVVIPFVFDKYSRDLPIVTISTSYLPDFSEKKPEQDGPWPVIYRGDFLAEKEMIRKASVGDQCSSFIDGRLPRSVGTSDFCEIQQHGDSKGTLVIFVPYEDKEIGYLIYSFYKGDYAFSIRGSFSRRVAGSGDYMTDTYLDMKVITDAYKNGTGLKRSIRLFLGTTDDSKEQIKIVNFYDFFERFKTAIDAVRYTK